MRLTTTLQQPSAVQDAEGTVVGCELDPAVQHINSKIRTTSAPEMKCSRIPKAIYVKLDDCDLHCGCHLVLAHRIEQLDTMQLAPSALVLYSRASLR